MSEKRPLCNYSGTVKEMIAGDTVVGHDTYHGIQAVGAIAFDPSSHILSIASVTYWYAGTPYTSATPISCDLDLTADRDHASASLTANTLYYFYFKDASGKLYWSPTMWNLQTTVPVATIFWNGAAGSVSKEAHGYSRNLDWHIWAHMTIGARYGAGLNLTYPTTTVDGSMQVESGTIYDEDISVTIGQQTTMRGWYRPSAGAWTFSDYALPYTGTLGAPVYLNTGTYALTAYASNRYACFWVFATGDVDRPIAVVPTHASGSYSTVTTARAEVQPTVSGVNPEWKLIYRWIYTGDGQFIESADYRLQTSLAGGVSSATTAGAVSFVPSGNVAATTVQGAIEELDTEKVAHALATAENDVLVGAPSPFGSWVKKTIAEFKTILGLGSAAYTASTAYDPAGTADGKIASSISDGDTTHAPDGNSVFDALALKANLISPSFTTPALGTPSSGTLTNCTGLPQAGVTGLTTSDSPVFGTVKLSGLTDGYIPKHTSDAVGLANSPIYTDGTNVGIGNVSPTQSMDLSGNLRFRGGLVEGPNGGTIVVNAYYDSGWKYRSNGYSGNYYITDGEHIFQRAISGNSGDTVSYIASMMIKNDGKIGIGAASPGALVGIAGNLSVGATYAAIAAPASGAIIEGRVGIGTNNPTGKLVIVDISRVTEDCNVGAGALRISTGTGLASDDSLIFGVHDGDYSWIQAVDAGNSHRNLILNPQGANVGIGDTSPSYKLSIYNSTELGNTVASVTGITTFTAHDTLGFNPYLKIFALRNSTVDTGWRGVSLRMQMQVQATNMGYIEFNPVTSAGNETAGLALGASNTEIIRLVNGNVGIGTSSPANILSLGGNAARKFWMERHTTADTAGNSLTIQGGSATASATNKAGGQLILVPGLSTGTGESGVTVQGCLAGSTGTTDGTLQDMVKVLGNKIGFYNATPVTKAAHIADATDAATAITRINAILAVLENLGLVATS